MAATTLLCPNQHSSDISRWRTTSENPLLIIHMSTNPLHPLSSSPYTSTTTLALALQLRSPTDRSPTAVTWTSKRELIDRSTGRRRQFVLRFCTQVRTGLWVHVQVPVPVPAPAPADAEFERPMRKMLILERDMKYHSEIQVNGSALVPIDVASSISALATQGNWSRNTLTDLFR